MVRLWAAYLSISWSITNISPVLELLLFDALANLPYHFELGVRDIVYNVKKRAQVSGCLGFFVEAPTIYLSDKLDAP